MSPKELTERIKAQAAALGLDKVGVAPAALLERERSHLKDWLTRGYQATMRWMEKDPDRRSDPRLLVPGARSVLSVAVNYYHPAVRPDDADHGKISRYAWGDDYHRHLTSRIQTLFDCISQWEPGSSGRYYVDTGPVMEKAWAVRAGIGWQGKHTNVITREFGSWVFLGEIITTADLVYDTPAEDLCGTCTACLDACPTGAIPEPYVVDAGRCISYLTIEHRGEIAHALGERFDRWIYGCDICQDVCPWNRFQKETQHPEYRPREGGIAPELKEIVSLTQEEFSARFRHSPVKRTKREGLQRNASIILRNEQKPDRSGPDTLSPGGE